MDQQEFATRAEAIKARLYRTAYLYLGSEADALDAVSEAICRALDCQPADILEYREF